MIKNVFVILVASLALFSCNTTTESTDVDSDYAINPETGDTVLTSTAYCQTSIRVTKDVKLHGLNDTITISFGESKCTSNENVSPSTIVPETDKCEASWRTNGGSNPLNPSDCMYHDSYVYLQLHTKDKEGNSIQVGTIYFYETNSSSYKLKSCEGTNGYDVTCVLIDNVTRNSTYETVITPSATK